MARPGRTGKLKWGALCLSMALVVAATVSAATPDWQSSLTKDPPGKIPLPRSLHARYSFGWSGFSAATADVHFSRVPQDRHCVLEGTGHTVGLARALWRYDVNYRAVADSDSLRPIHVKQSETTRKKTVTTDLSFTSSGVDRLRVESGQKSPHKPKPFNLADLYDLHAAMLYLRSQPLTDRNTYRVAVYPTTNAYVVNLAVIGREKISVRAGSYNAIKLSLQLSKVGKDLALEPHKKFKRATIWISDDDDRLVLRIEAQIFVGTVFAELQSAQFDSKG